MDSSHYDWFIQVDDDSVLLMQNLITYLESLNPKGLHFLGESSYEMLGTGPNKKCNQEGKIVYGGAGRQK